MDNNKKTEKDWRKELTPEEYRVMREKGTEAPFTGKYVNEHERGMYHCRGCGAELFSSDAKFDSGTGWPSFDQALPGAVETHPDTDHGMARTEITCARCGGHLGHIFDDGPTGPIGPSNRLGTGKRYCINSVCLDLAERP